MTRNPDGGPTAPPRVPMATVIGIDTAPHRVPEACTGEVQGACTMSSHHDQDFTPDDAERAVLAELDVIVNDIATFETRIGPRWRRIVRALHGLGLLDLVGRDWVAITPDGLAFGDLTAAQADRLARLLEDLENGKAPEPSSTPPPDHPRLEFPQPVVPPNADADPHHFGAWR